MCYNCHARPHVVSQHTVAPAVALHAEATDSGGVQDFELDEKELGGQLVQLK